MSQLESCPHCKAPVESDQRRCSECGKKLGGASAQVKVFSLVAAFLLVSGSVVLWWVYHHRKSEQHIPVSKLEVARTGSTNPSLLENGTHLDYERCPDGNTLDVHITGASDNPLLVFDTNRNGIADPGDFGYAVDSYSKQCVFHLANPQSLPLCLTPKAQPRLTRQDVQSSDSSSHNVDLQIPLSDLPQGKEGADFVVGIFHEQTQQVEYLPGAPLFKSVYHLKLDEIPSPSTPKYCGTTRGNSVAPELGGNVPPITSQPPNKLVPPPTVTYFEATPSRIEFKGEVHLRWSVSGSTNVSITPGIGDVLAMGETNVHVEQPVTYALRARNGGGEATSSVSVDVTPPQLPQIANFSAQPQVVTGNSTRLSWNVTGFTTNIRIEPGMTSLPAQGERDIPIDHSLAFHLIADGPGGSTDSNVLVTYKPEKPKIVFTAAKPNIYKGETTSLRWNVVNANHISVEPGIADYPVDSSSVNGEIRVTPDETTRYTLHAEGPGGKATASVDVFIRPPGPQNGQLVWTGDVHGTQLVTVDLDHADTGSLVGSLPGMPCILQPEKEKVVSIASTPGPRNDYRRLVLRVKGNGMTTVVINWSLQ